MADKNAFDMYLTGPAGTGKTTELGKVVAHLMTTRVNYIVCAYTHKACGVLRSKLPPGANINTLHAFLKKRPGINDRATKAGHVDINTKMGDSDKVDLIIIDEYSMVGEKDYTDIAMIQDQNEDGTPSTKLMYVGDPFQLTPVKDMQAIEPSGKYWKQLTKVHRTDHDDLMAIAIKLIAMVQGAPLEPLPSSENFIRGKNIIKEYKATKSLDKIILAWTNQKVQEINFALAGRDRPELLDDLWNSSLRHELVFTRHIEVHEVTHINTPTGVLQLGTKYKTLEFLKDQPFVQFFEVENTTLGEPEIIATHFGTANHKNMMASLTHEAAECNAKIFRQTGKPATDWARANPSNKMAKARGLAWRRLLSFKDAVMCVDFPYAMTIHKSQGSTFEEVYLDSDDLAKCANFSTSMYARLFYVAISRAAKKVITT